MKRKVNCLWLKEENTDIVNANSLQELLMHNRYVGFIPTTQDNRYMVLSYHGSENNGWAVRPNGYWGEVEESATQEGEYFIFDTAKELFLWLAEGEE